MDLVKRIVGARSKYDRTLPYTYEARVPITGAEGEFQTFFADTICGLLDLLRREGVRIPDHQSVEAVRL